MLAHPVIPASPTPQRVTDMGAVVRVLGGVWIGIGLLNAYLLYWEQGLTDRALVSNMLFYGLPGLLLLILGSVIRKKA